MRIKRFTPSAPIFPEVEFDADKPICFLCGRAETVYLNLIRSFTMKAIMQSGPVSADEADFGTSAQLELDGKEYELRYLLERDDSYSFAALSPSDRVGIQRNATEEVRAKMRKYGFGSDNVFDGRIAKNDIDLLSFFATFAGAASANTSDDRPLFLYNFFDRVKTEFNLPGYLSVLPTLGRQILIAVGPDYPEEKLAHPNVQVVNMGR